MIEFDGYSLKEGFYELSLDDIKKYFVEGVESEQRVVIFDGFKRYCKEIDGCIDRYAQVIDGSFTTKKKEPNDIDVVTFIDIEDILTNKAFLSDLKSKNCKIEYYVDGYIELFCDNPKEADYMRYFQKRWDYWIGMFEKDRDLKPKGLVLRLCKMSKESIC